KWDGAYWKDVKAVKVDNFHVRSTSHRPVILCKATHSGDQIHIFFKVDDNYVRSVNTRMQDPVSRDSSVEFFVMPPNPTGAYFNFEINAGGTLYLSYVEDPSRKPLGPLAKFTLVDEKWLPELHIKHSMPTVVEPEIQQPTTWTIQFSAPVALFEEYMDKKLGRLGGQTWRANFYKCGDKTSHPHWASWTEIGSELNFHLPERFGTIIFE
ncbi:MAG TPA: carbohydrate-binding family 9-like protein, partial [Phycisphaerae bacterium]|nr:carbohydrate-binding family 9-like protein [Phycisphaerae bacterium]